MLEARIFTAILIAICCGIGLVACTTSVELPQDPSETPSPMDVDYPEVVYTHGWLDFSRLEVVPASAGGPPEGAHLKGIIEGRTFLPPYGKLVGADGPEPAGMTLIGGWLHLPTRRFHPSFDAKEAPFPRVSGFRIDETGGFLPRGPVEYEAPAPTEVKEAAAADDGA